jgi:uncharacterized protein YecE (DUF72 family)
MTIHIGCCGFARARSEYFRHFEVVEVQQTFYRLPRLATVQAWRNEAPAGFLFAMKAWQIITHPASSPTYRRAGVIPDDPADHFGFFRPTDEVFQAWSRTREIAEAVHAPVVLFQCPASFDPTDDHVANLIAFARQVDRGGLAFAWEPRGRWPDTTVRVLCAELNQLHAVDPFLRQPLTEGRAYFRLHGRTGYRYRYTDADLQQLIAWCSSYREVYCFFNNVTMWEDALRLKAELP